MYTPKFELLSFASLPQQRKQIVLRALLEALVVADWNYLLEHPNTPSLYDADMRYVLKVRPGGLDAWQDIPQCIALGSGDCKDFACWRIAELRHQGYDDVYPHIKVAQHPDPKGVEPPMTVYHIQVRIHDIIEDPSAILGMPTHASYEQLKGEPSAVAQHQIAAGMWSETPEGLYVPQHDEGVYAFDESYAYPPSPNFNHPYIR